MAASKVEILGPGCAKCKSLETAARQAVANLGVACEVTKVSDMGEIVRRGVMSTPALVVDGKIVCTGRIPSGPEIEAMVRSGGGK